MFDNLEEKRKKIATQKRVSDKVIKKKAGRPKSPEKGRYHIKMPVLLHKKVKEKAKVIGLDVSSFICTSLVEKIAKMEIKD